MRKCHGSWHWNSAMCPSLSQIPISHTWQSRVPSDNFRAICLRLSPPSAGMREINHLRNLGVMHFFNQPFNYFLSKIGCCPTRTSTLAPRPPLHQTTPPTLRLSWPMCPTPTPVRAQSPAPQLAEPRAAPAVSSSAGQGRSTVTPSGYTAAP